ncbi:MAG TPA: VTT domain-containing protein [Vicinamibacterales bacterium]|nr:VTT domain-containing protein [Vicinamibacterales bacterium]
MLVYLSIYIAAIIEGEAYYIIQCSLAASGVLNWAGVLIAGALGGATGDQFWFYLLRGRVHWLDRYPKIARFERRVRRHVHEHETLIILAGRFLPGLRTAIPAACAVADVRARKFSALNLVSAFAWAGTIMLLVKGGALTMGAIGLQAWWAPFIPAALLLLFIFWVGRPARGQGQQS